ncbi:MAG TPA: hypothetical protein DHW36_05980 [Thalassospira sp.]|nr:hypothetical protein [Thalassospira sp.]
MARVTVMLLPYSAAFGAVCAALSLSRSTTFTLVWMRVFDPSWKVIMVSISTLSFPA